MNNKHSHRWALLMTGLDGVPKRHCFLCNTTQKLISGTKWINCETATFLGKPCAALDAARKGTP